MNFALFVANRLAQLVPTFIGATLVAFVLLRVLPGDPATLLIGTRGSAADIAQLHHDLGLDAPLWSQYLAFMRDVSTGSFGQSIMQRRPVSTIILERLAPTRLLTGFAVLLTAAMTLPLAAFAAARRGRVADYAIRSLAVAVMAMPQFWLGILLILLLGIRIPIFPVAGYGDSFADHLWHLFLPALVVAFGTASLTIRSLRSSLIAVRSADYIDTARAKGLEPGAVFREHMLRNSLISTVSVLSVRTSWIIGGSVIIEAVFALPGLGSLLVNAIVTRDYPVVQGLTVVFAVLVMAIGVLTDVAYAALDPRIKLR